MVSAVLSARCAQAADPLTCTLEELLGQTQLVQADKDRVLAQFASQNREDKLQILRGVQGLIAAGSVTNAEDLAEAYGALAFIGESSAEMSQRSNMCRVSKGILIVGYILSVLSFLTAATLILKRKPVPSIVANLGLASPISQLIANLDMVRIAVDSAFPTSLNRALAITSVVVIIMLGVVKTFAPEAVLFTAALYVALLGTTSVSFTLAMNKQSRDDSTSICKVVSTFSKMARDGDVRKEIEKLQELLAKVQAVTPDFQVPVPAQPSTA